jgi:hypothetical protein
MEKRCKRKFYFAQRLRSAAERSEVGWSGWFGDFIAVRHSTLLNQKRVEVESPNASYRW